MGNESNSPQPRNRADHMANERTFLSWMRTSLGLMAFGFVVERFALFLKQIPLFFGEQGVLKNAPVPTLHQGYSSIFGICIVALGAIIGLFAFFKYKSIERQIEEDSFQSSAALAIILTSVVVIIGVFLVIYLLNS